LAIDAPLSIVIVPAEGVKVALPLTVKAPLALKLLEVVTVALVAMARPLKVNAPELEIDPPLFIVMVPLDGAKVALLLTVNAPPTLKLLEVVTVAEAATVRPLKVRVPEFEIDAPLFIVMVPAEGAKVALLLAVNAPPTEKLLDVVTVADAATVKLKKVKVPELEIDEPLFIVTVPLVGVKVPVTVKAPPTAAVLPEPVMEPLTFRAP
jgi:hypothetical protein